MRPTNAATRLAIVGFCIACASCGPAAPSTTNAFLLRESEIDFQEASGLVLHSVSASLQAERGLGPGYPLVGQLVTEPDPLQANVQQMRCAETDTLASPPEACILLNRAGDFVRVQPITWQTEAFHMYRIYLSSPSIFSNIDPSKDFVAVDVFVLHEPGLWETVDRAIRRTAEEIGARPIRP